MPIGRNARIYANHNHWTDIKEEKAPKTAYDNDDSLDLDSEEYDLDGF